MMSFQQIANSSKVTHVVLTHVVFVGLKPIRTYCIRKTESFFSSLNKLTVEEFVLGAFSVFTDT